MPKGVPHVKSKRRNDPAWKDEQAWRALATALGYSTPFVDRYAAHPRVVRGLFSEHEDDDDH